MAADPVPAWERRAWRAQIAVAAITTLTLLLGSTTHAGACGVLLGARMLAGSSWRGSSGPGIRAQAPRAAQPSRALFRYIIWAWNWCWLKPRKGQAMGRRKKLERELEAFRIGPSYDFGSMILKDELAFWRGLREPATPSLQPFPDETPAARDVWEEWREWADREYYELLASVGINGLGIAP